MDGFYLSLEHSHAVRVLLHHPPHVYFVAQFRNSPQLVPDLTCLLTNTGGDSHGCLPRPLLIDAQEGVYGLGSLGVEEDIAQIVAVIGGTAVVPAIGTVTTLHSPLVTLAIALTPPALPLL